jgi:head-tail adaptor
MITFMKNKAISEIEQEIWSEEIRAHAEIKPLCESNFQYLEDMTFGNFIPEALFLFKLRYIPEITLDMRILFDNRNFEIKRVINLGEVNRYLQIICLEI